MEELYDKNKFLGEYVFSNYIVNRSYLPGNGPQLRLYYNKFTPITNHIAASLAILHGFGEHSGQFLHIADFFASKGLEVHLIDLRGFGYSGGPRGCATSPQLLSDLATLLQQVNPNLPLFLYGHSMGGLLALLFSLLNPTIKFNGIITTSPLIGFPQERKLDFFKLNFVKTVGKSLEDLVINSMVNPTALTKNNSYLRSVFNDKLQIPFLGLNMAGSLLSATDFLKQNAFKIIKPILVLHGKLDSVTNYKESIQFYEKCSSIEKHLKIFDNGMHEILHDEELEEFKKIVHDWILRRLENASTIG